MSLLRIVDMTDDFSNVFSKSLKCSRISLFLVNKQIRMAMIILSTFIISSGFKTCFIKLSSYIINKIIKETNIVEFSENEI